MPKILIVDDERMIADTLSVIFEGQGYQAFTAYNGLLGLDAARTVEPDVVLTDVMMPGLDGVSMAMQLNIARPQLPVLLFSGQAATADLLRDAEAKGFHFEVIQKPVHPEEIIKKIAVMVSGISKPSEGGSSLNF